MALTDPYATPAEYRAAVTKNVADDDGRLTDQLAAATEEISLRLGRRFGLAAAASAYLLDGNGETVLWLHPPVPDIANVTGLVVRVDEDGDNVPEVTLAKDTDYWLEPATPEPGWPYEALRVNPNSGEISEWPQGPRTVEITATWGWPAVPGMIRELTIQTVRNMRDLQEAGSSLQIAAFDQVIQYSPDTRRLWLETLRMFGRGRHF